MNEEEDIRGGATDEQLNQAYKEAKINEQRDPRTDEKFLEERAKQKEAENEETEEEDEGPDPSQGVALPIGNPLSDALFLKNPGLAFQAGLLRTISTKISKIDGVQQLLTKAQEQLPSISQKGVQEFKTQAAGRVANIVQKLQEQFPADDVEGLVMELKKRKKKAVNKKPFGTREDADIVPTLNDIKNAMSKIGDKKNQMLAKQIRRVYLAGVRDIRGLRNFMNVTLREGLPAATDKGAAQNLRDLAEYLNMTPADLSNIIKDNDVSVNKIKKGEIRKGKDIKTMGDLNEAMLSRMKRLKLQPFYNIGHETSVQKILEQFSTGATRPDNIFLERARTMYKLGPDGKPQQVGEPGNLQRQDTSDDPVELQRMLGFAPSIEESVYNLTQISEENLATLYRELGIDASDLDVRPNIDPSRLINREMKAWTESTARSLIEKSNVDPEKVADFLLDINESIGNMLADAQKRGEIDLLIKIEPGLAAEFLKPAMTGYKKGFKPKGLLNRRLSETERLILEQAEKYFKKNPIFKPGKKIKKKL